jgi:hypothetical protein
VDIVEVIPAALMPSTRPRLIWLLRRQAPPAIAWLTIDPYRQIGAGRIIETA